MKNSNFILILLLFWSFTLSTPAYSVNKSRVTKYNSTLKQAKSGSPKAMFLVARMLEYGKGTKKNINEASKWYQRSASQNYAAANARLGKLYLEGIGVKKNTKKAFSLLNLAAIQGIPVAQFNLAIVYELGVGTQKDLEEAIKWYGYAEKGGYYTAKSKGNNLRKKLGISTTSTSFVQSTNVDEREIKNSPQQSIEKTETSKKPQESDQANNEFSDSDNSEEQALLSNTFDRTETKAKNISLKISSLDRKQKLDLIKNQHIKRTLETLLSGRWFDDNRPVNFLPSPKTKCSIVKRSDIKCTSRELQRHTDKETVFYKTLGKITKLTSKGSFLIQYQNTVVRVVVDKDLDEDGVIYQTKIKTGPQQTIHQLNCQYKDIRNLMCIKDKTNNYIFKNRAIIEETL